MSKLREYKRIHVGLNFRVAYKLSRELGQSRYTLTIFKYYLPSDISRILTQ